MMTRKKIMPEDLIQRTNIVQHNFMIDAINDLDERQVIVEDKNAVNTEDVASLKTNIAILSNEKLDKDDINKDLHFGEITLTREGTSVMATLDVLNPATGVTTPISFTIPGATTTLAGVMPADDAAWITNAEARISALEGMANVKALVGLSMTPSQEEINGQWLLEVGEAPTTGDMMQDVSNGRLWVYVNNAWIIYATVVDIPLATTGSLGGVRDTALDAPANRWYCHVEADGRLALIGGDSLSTLLDTTIPGMQATLNGHTGNTSNPHAVTKAQIGLGAYPASPADIGISTATQAALALKADKTEVALKADITYVDTEIAGIDVAPPIATEAEAIAGVDDTKMMTPLKVQQAIFHFIAQPPTPADIAPYLPPVNCTALLTMYKNNTSITETPIINAKNCTSLRYVFYGCSNLTTVGYIHCPNVRDMDAMFQNCSSLTTIPSFDISSVTSMNNMFFNCTSLTSVTFQCNNVRPYSSDMFYNTPIASGNGYIFVPDGLVQAYRTATGWSAHASVIFGHSDKP